MLGYVKAYKPELRMREYELYQGVYCSLCRSLGKRYSPLAQLFLNYDFTFLALLRLASVSRSPGIRQKRCPYRPMKKCPGCENNAEIDLCADAVILTVYYKLKDNLRDAGFLKKIASLCVFPLVTLMRCKAKRISPRIDELICTAMREQTLTEAANADNRTLLDAAAHPTAYALSQIASLGEYGEKKRQLARIGYCVGRWVYILDAADDLERDTKSGDFNPFFARQKQKGRSETLQYAEQLLHITAAEAVAALEQTDLFRFREILENVLYDGLTAQMQVVLPKTQKEAGGVDIARSI